jgi:hypothetical protein
VFEKRALLQFTSCLNFRQFNVLLCWDERALENLVKRFRLAAPNLFSSNITYLTCICMYIKVPPSRSCCRRSAACMLHQHCFIVSSALFHQHCYEQRSIFIGQNVWWNIFIASSARSEWNCKWNFERNYAKTVFKTTENCTYQIRFCSEVTRVNFARCNFVFCSHPEADSYATEYWLFTTWSLCSSHHRPLSNNYRNIVC